MFSKMVIQEYKLSDTFDVASFQTTRRQFSNGFWSQNKSALPDYYFKWTQST